MIKKWIKVVLYVVAAIAMATSTTVATIQGRHLKDVRMQVSEQSRVIDSLLTLKRTYFTASLYVTDKSVAKVYGSHNKGTITMPSERTYRLEIDSANIKMR